MNISSVAAAVSAQSQAQLQDQVSLLMLKKAMEMQEAHALQMLQALPQMTPVTASGSLGTRIDTFA